VFSETTVDVPFRYGEALVVNGWVWDIRYVEIRSDRVDR
jgi:hypothetical protein